jgi:hypothetical protein
LKTQLKPSRLLTRSLIVATLTVLCLSIFTQFAYASSEIVATGYLISSDGVLKVSGALYKDIGELDPLYDYYAIKLTLQDMAYASNSFVDPLWAGVRIAVALTATETPTNHQPMAQTISQQLPISFSYNGISFSAYLPKEKISYWERSDTNYRYFDWEADGRPGILTIPGAVFTDWSDFNIGIRVPQGYRPTVFLQGWAQWYRYHGSGMWSVEVYENVYWVTLSAPGMAMQGFRDATVPTPINPLSQTSNVLSSR